MKLTVMWIGEDVDLHWGLRKLAGRTGRNVRLLREPAREAACRCFDERPVWTILVWTNPRKLTGRTGRNVRLLREPAREAACRRFDERPVWTILVWTNPVVAGLLRRGKPDWRAGTRMR